MWNTTESQNWVILKIQLPWTGCPGWAQKHASERTYNSNADRAKDCNGAMGRKRFLICRRGYRGECACLHSCKSAPVFENQQRNSV